MGGGGPGDDIDHSLAQHDGERPEALRDAGAVRGQFPLQRAARNRSDCSTVTATSSTCRGEGERGQPRRGGGRLVPGPRAQHRTGVAGMRSWAATKPASWPCPPPGVDGGAAASTPPGINRWCAGSSVSERSLEQVNDTDARHGGTNRPPARSEVSARMTRLPALTGDHRWSGQTEWSVRWAQ